MGVMELNARTSHLARLATLTVALGALLALIAGPADADAAKKKRYPVVTSVSPMNAKVGETITIRGRYFIRGKNKNSVVFKRDGARAIFAKETLGTAKQIRVVVPEALRRYLTENVPARVRLRVLSARFGKSFTSVAKSPRITAEPVPAAGTPASGATGSTGSSSTPSTGGSAPAPARVCTGDEDGDWLDATLENDLGLDACKADSDADGVPDGYEYQAARDLNDDEYQSGNEYPPYPGQLPYPNALFADANQDYDRDGLPQIQEYRLSKAFGSAPVGALPRDDYRLLYSDGEQYSLSTRVAGTGRRVPSQPAATYPKGAQFLDWATNNGYNPVLVPKAAPWYDAANSVSFDIRDVNHSGGAPEGPRAGYLSGESFIYDRDADAYISDDERDEDADGLSNVDELRGRMAPGFWKKCYESVGEVPYPVEYAGTDLADGDSDNDGIRDGADDQDHDDIPNLMELSRNMASGHTDWDAHDGQCVIDSTITLELPDGPDADDDPDLLEDWHAADYGRVNPFNPCLPYAWSRTCARGVEFGAGFAPFDKSTDWFALQ